MYNIKIDKISDKDRYDYSELIKIFLPPRTFRLLSENDTGTVIRTPLTPSGVFTLEDRLAFAKDGSFTLLGRRDCITKIGEERISLDEVNQIIRKRLGFSARSLAITRGNQTRIGVVVEDPNGTQFDRTKTASYVQTLRGYLPTPALPRFWRVVTRFPVNDRGKLDRKHMEALFDATDC